ncbi:nuclear transport factor 2 family protein [Eudoraea chungangensis]|uniref:nuclear transport factor 2 family protein n=1 Tax=Eudoraea chungangensis TaxID=1481905 RepID=UPI0023EC5E3B|nr:nuclear transport factor 2 family protein [Eudoraea chungangensis]
MSTNDVANKLIERCREGKFLEAINDLYDDSIVSQEMPGMPNETSTGIKAVYQKSEDWINNVQEFHTAKVSEPMVAGNHFSMRMSFDVTFKDRGRQQMDELCVYEVKDGKIVREQFFYSF